MDRSRDKQKRGQKSTKRNRYSREKRHRLGISTSAIAAKKRAEKEAALKH